MAQTGSQSMIPDGKMWQDDQARIVRASRTGFGNVPDAGRRPVKVRPAVHVEYGWPARCASPVLPASALRRGGTLTAPAASNRVQREV